MTGAGDTDAVARAQERKEKIAHRLTAWDDAASVPRLVTGQALYEHQKEALPWLRQQTRCGLWDEQGLGKTITAIAAADGLAERVLVLAPSVVLWNWVAELKKWRGEGRLQVLAKGSDRVNLGTSGVAVTTHGLLLRPAFYYSLCRWKPQLLIVDEAHNFRSHRASRTRRLFGVPGRPEVEALVRHCTRVWCLTATPTPNNCSELHPFLKGLWPESWPDFDEFRERYCALAPTDYGPDGVKVVGNKRENLEELRGKLRSCFLRRLKKDCLTLPDRRFEQVVVRPEKLPPRLAEMNVRLVELWRQAADEGAALAKVADDTEFATWRRLSGLAKAEPAAALLHAELNDGPGKVVVFVHHIEVGDVLARVLAPFGVVRIDGSKSPLQRTQAVVDFQQEGGPRVALCNIVAGGTGITLTAASEAVFVELSPTPGDNAQAADRIHRIGQQHKVRVRFVALAGSVDEVYSEVLRRKTAMIREVLQ